VLEQLTGQTPVFTKARYTVRTFGIRRNEKIACYVTVRGEKAMNLIVRPAARLPAARGSGLRAKRGRPARALAIRSSALTRWPPCLARSQESGLKVKEFELLRKNFSETGNFGAQRVAAGEAMRGRCAASSQRSLASSRRLWHQRAHRPGSEVRSVDGHLRCVPAPSCASGAPLCCAAALSGPARRAAALDKLIAYWRSTAVRASCV
jgi:hypothetical protein